jgi:lysophospholipase L1-like esterase
MTPYQTTIRKSNQYSLSDVAKAVKKVAALYDIPVLDMYSLGNYALEMNQDDSDGVHPSQEFIAEYTAPQIAEFLRRNYE